MVAARGTILTKENEYSSKLNNKGFIGNSDKGQLTNQLASWLKARMPTEHLWRLNRSLYKTKEMSVNGAHMH